MRCGLRGAHRPGSKQHEMIRQLNRSADTWFLDPGNTRLFGNEMDVQDYRLSVPSLDGDCGHPDRDYGRSIVNHAKNLVRYAFGAVQRSGVWTRNLGQGTPLLLDRGRSAEPSVLDGLARTAQSCARSAHLGSRRVPCGGSCPVLAWGPMNSRAHEPAPQSDQKRPNTTIPLPVTPRSMDAVARGSE
jgi:hypothetical protein